MIHSLITGGAGFIGSNLADALIERGDRVTVIDDLSTGRRENLAGALAAGAELLSGDIVDGSFVAETFASIRPDRVFHLAAQADVRRAVSEPDFDARVNVVGTINVLEGARANGSPPLVFAATGGAVYGEGEGRELPFAESAPARPETAYGASKLAGEVYLDLYRRTHGLPAMALRFANVYGPRQDPHGEAGVVAIFCGRLLAGEAPVVYGDGRQTRDYVFVADVVEAMLAAESRLAMAGEVPAGPVNVGTGIEASVLDLVEMLGAASGRRVEPELRPRRAGEVQRVAVDPTAAAELLGWRARTDLERGLRLTLAEFGERTA
jgi:UDP-glucose 4-epimerase